MKEESITLDVYPFRSAVFCRKRIPKSSCARKGAVDIDILITSRNNNRKLIQSIRITIGPPMRKKKWNQSSQFS